jgi:hypothetical protein
VPSLHKKGDLVHIPQAVVLVGCDEPDSDPQLVIPLRIEETQSPRIGVIAGTYPKAGYVRIYCDGDMWSVKGDSIYSIEERRV